MHRRKFLTGLAAIGLAGTGLTVRATTGRRLIDVHNHVIPPFYLAENRDRIDVSLTRSRFRLIYRYKFGFSHDAGAPYGSWTLGCNMTRWPESLHEKRVAAAGLCMSDQVQQTASPLA